MSLEPWVAKELPVHGSSLSQVELQNLQETFRRRRRSISLRGFLSLLLCLLSNLINMSLDNIIIASGLCLMIEANLANNIIQIRMKSQSPVPKDSQSSIDIHI